MSESREILLFWPIAIVVWVATLIGVAVLFVHAAVKDGWNRH